MTDQTKCPACDVAERVEGTHRIYTCTGRPGCVQHPNRETPAPEKPPAGAGVPEGKTDIVERLRRTLEEMANRCSVPMDVWDRHANAVLMSAAEIARLRAEVERLTGELAAQTSDTTEALEALAVEMADRAALATRVAELEAKVERLTGERDAVCRAIPDRFLLDPPDGGTVYPEEAIQRMVADRAALAQRVAELEAGQAWRPIETAPKDGAQFIAINKYGDMTYPIKWDVDRQMWVEYGLDGFDTMDWIRAERLDQWMPIPEPQPR